MKIIEQSHEILGAPYDALERIEKAARTCYKSEDKITPGSAEKLVSRLVKMDHMAMIEFADMTVKFITNRGVTHELVRHRLCNFAQESTRYVKYNGEMEFIKPVWFTQTISENWGQGKNNINSGHGKTYPDDIRSWIAACIQSELMYKAFLNTHGWKAQQAREVLPNSLKTEIVVKANLREWVYIFKLRCASTAHPQMYELMRPLLKEVQQRIPIIFDNIVY